MRLTTDWLDFVFSKSPAKAWPAIFERLENIVKPESQDIKTLYRTLEREIGHIDHVLAASAWDLWEAFHAAPKGSDYVRTFWNQTVGPKAVLVLDSLSMREIAPICEQISAMGVNIAKIKLAASEAPSETDIYAKALGLSGRFELSQRPAPAQFFVPRGDAYVDAFKKIPFEESASRIPNDKNLFIWHGWPDDSLHDLAKVDDAFNRFIDHVKETVESGGFKKLIRTLARGRELLITSDHGYCDTSGFPMAQDDEHKELKTLGHTRAKAISEDERLHGRTIPPATVEMTATSGKQLYRIAVGRRRPSDKGFPALTHGGLSLMECTVPLIHVGGASL